LSDKIILTPGFGDSRNSATIYIGDCIESLKSMPEKSVQTCITSPPYWGLRDYGHDGQIGLEQTPDEYIAKMVEVFGEVRRVLRDDGTLWLNLGDSYWSDTPSRKDPVESMWGNRPARDISDGRGNIPKVNRRGGLGTTPKGIKPKDLVGIPWRVALALQADGWWLRQDIIWHKSNPMPESITDRCTKSHEYIFLLAKSNLYYFDHEAIKEKSVTGDTRKPYGSDGAWGMDGRDKWEEGKGQQRPNADGSKRNRRSVWSIKVKPYTGAHFATFPEKLVEPMVLAGSSEVGCCPSCGAPWGRGENIVEWEPTCDCPEHRPVPCLVLDPFTGSGTTGAVSLRLGRNFVGCELNPEYAKLAESRILGESPPDSEESGESDSDSVFDLFGNDEG
jgi:DNA modification methylase